MFFFSLWLWLISGKIPVMAKKVFMDLKYLMHVWGGRMRKQALLCLNSSLYWRLLSTSSCLILRFISHSCFYDFRFYIFKNVLKNESRPGTVNLLEMSARFATQKTFLSQNADTAVQQYHWWFSLETTTTHRLTMFVIKEKHDNRAYNDANRFYWKVKSRR